MKPVLLPNTGHVDSRGQFQRIFDKQTIGLKNLELQQVNISKNPLAQTLRGMHFQVAGPPEHKFITVLSGTIYLVVSNAHIVSKKMKLKITTSNCQKIFPKHCLSQADWLLVGSRYQIM